MEKMTSANDVRGFAFYFWRFMFYFTLVSSIFVLLVGYPFWLGWLPPKVYFGFIPLMSVLEFYVDIGFGVSALIWLNYYWPGRIEYQHGDV